jgi:hypothetical protein
VNIGCGLAAARAVAAVAVMLASSVLAAPVLGGVDCSLQATVGGGSATEVEVGEEVLIEGFGFPPNADIDVTYSVEGEVISTETVTADGTGFFDTTVVPASGQEGLWSVTATDTAETCTAETGFLVVGGATPTPAPTPTPVPTPTQGELPDVAASGPPAPNQLILAGAVLLAAAAWLSVRRLARLLR